MSKLTEGLSKEEIKLLKNLNIRTWVCHLTWSYTRVHGTATGWSMYRFISWLYPNKEDKEKKIAALNRQSKEYFCMTPQINVLPISIFAAMEKEAAEHEDFDTSSITAVKASIQGPLSGIGDSFFWITLRTIVTGLCIPWVMSGNPMGFLLWAILMNAPVFILRYYLTFIGYKMGTNFISKIFDSGLIDIITKTATTIGLVMIGGMIASTVSVPISLVVNLGGSEMVVSDIFNGIFPGCLELALSLLIIWMVKKKVNIMWIIVSIFAIAILGSAVGLF